MSKYNFESVRADYLTPPALVQLSLNYFGLTEFDLDTCCCQKNIPAKCHYVYGENDGLAEDWKRFNWCNPPYKQMQKWVKKAYDEQQKGNSTAMLIPVRTETKYFHEYILYNNDVDIHWLRKGFEFIHPETHEPMGVFKNALALVYFKGVRQMNEGVRSAVSYMTERG